MHFKYRQLLIDAGVPISDDEMDVLKSPPQSPTPPTPTGYWDFAPGATMKNTIDKNGIPFGVEWNDYCPPRRTHRYSREYRFRVTVAQLMGCYTRNIPDNVINTVRENLKYRTPVRIWNGVRRILKNNGWRRYYLEIPHIIRVIDGQEWSAPPDTLQQMMYWFNFLNQIFNKSKYELDRKYFPPMQYIALRLLQEKCGAVAPYKIPVARTVRKRASLALIYDKLLSGQVIEPKCTQKYNRIWENSVYN